MNTFSRLLSIFPCLPWVAVAPLQKSLGAVGAELFTCLMPNPENKLIRHYHITKINSTSTYILLVEIWQHRPMDSSRFSPQTRSPTEIHSRIQMCLKEINANNLALVNTMNSVKIFWQMLPGLRSNVLVQHTVKCKKTIIKTCHSFCNTAYCGLHHPIFSIRDTGTFLSIVGIFIKKSDHTSEWQSNRYSLPFDKCNKMGWKQGRRQREQVCGSMCHSLEFSNRQQRTCTIPDSQHERGSCEHGGCPAFWIHSCTVHRSKTLLLLSACALSTATTSLTRYITQVNKI